MECCLLVSNPGFIHFALSNKSRNRLQHLVCSQPQYLKGTCVSKTLSRSTLYWWKRQSEIQRQSCMTCSKKELSDKYVHNHNFSGDQDTHIYTPPSTLTFKMFLSSSTACNPFLKAWGPRRKISNRKTWLFVAIYNKLRWQDEWGTKEQWIWRQEKVHCYIQDNLSRKGLC